MGNGWQLFSDILDPQRDPPMSRKKEVSVGHVELKGENNLNRLINDEGSRWTVQSKGESIITVGKNDSVPLKPGTVINFGEGRRLLVVEE
jgi:hypothetical protein